MGQVPRYEPYLDIPRGTFRWRLGLRQLDMDEWLQFDEGAESDLAKKRKWLDENHETVFVVEPDDDMLAASTEIYEAIWAVVPERFRVGLDGLHPLDAAGRMVQEDLVVMVERDGELSCSGGSVCFPNRWDLRSKVGLTMHQIHEPVPQLNEQLETAVDSSLSRLRPDRSFWRLGWTIIDTDELYQPVDGTAPASAPTTVTGPGDHWLRVERETLRRMPETGAVLFTIRTYLSPIGAIPAETSGYLADAIDAMDPEILNYKALGTAGQQVAAWLHAEG